MSARHKRLQQKLKQRHRAREKGPRLRFGYGGTIVIICIEVVISMFLIFMAGSGGTTILDAVNPGMHALNSFMLQMSCFIVGLVSLASMWKILTVS